MTAQQPASALAAACDGDDRKVAETTADQKLPRRFVASADRVPAARGAAGQASREADRAWRMVTPASSMPVIAANVVASLTPRHKSSSTTTSRSE